MWVYTCMLSQNALRNVGIIDDAALTRKILRMLMINQGYNVVLESGRGRDALESMAQEPPGILFLDIYLRGENGLDLLPLIRQRFPDTCVIMISAEGDDELAKQALTRGAFGFLPKPFACERVAQTLRDVLAKARCTA